MNTYSGVERMAGRTPYTSNGFYFLNKPEALIAYPIQGGRIHLFADDDYQRRLSKIQEYAVAIDQSGFQIEYWDAMEEVGYNTRKTRKDISIVAAFFEPDESSRAGLLKPSPKKGREGILISAFNKITTPITDFLTSQEKVKVNLELPFKAYSTHEVWKVSTDSGPLIVAYLSTIAAEPGLTGGGVIGPSLCLYPYNFIKPDVYAFRVQNGVPISAAEKANITEGPVFGVDVEWGTDPIMESLGKYFYERTRHPNGVDMDKLIARAIYPEGESRTYIHGKTQGRAFEATEKLRNRGVVATSGDGAYVAVWGKGKKEVWEDRKRKRMFVVPN